MTTLAPHATTTPTTIQVANVANVTRHATRSLSPRVCPEPHEHVETPVTAAEPLGGVGQLCAARPAPRHGRYRRRRRRLAAVRPGVLEVPPTKRFSKATWHASVQKRVAWSFSGVRQIAHFAIALPPTAL